MGTRSSHAGTSSTLRQHLVHVEACEASGTTLKAYAQRRGLSVQTLYQAKKIARQRGLLPPHRGAAHSDRSRSKRVKRTRPSRFIEAVRPPVAQGPVPAWRLRFASGEILESGTPLDVAALLRIVLMLRERS